MTDPSLSRTLRRARSTLRGVWMYWFGKTQEQRVEGWQILYALRMKMMTRMPQLATIIRSRSVRLFEDTKGFNRILRLLHRARFSIIIQMFIWRDDDTGRLVAETLLRAADKGVKVQITKEGVGDVFEGADDFLTTQSSSRDLWQKFWSHPNIEIRHEANYDHAKVFIIDQSHLLLTGMNIGDEYRWKWHDFVVELKGKNFIEEYLQSGSPRSRDVRIVRNVPAAKEMRGEVMKLLESARKSIVLEQAYLSDPEILQLLVEKADKNIAITIVLPQSPDIHHNANMQFIDTLLKSVRGRRPRVFIHPRMVHGKAILIDERRALIGSVNLIASSLDQMGEVAVLIQRKPRKVLWKLRNIIERDALQGKEIFSVPPRPLLRWILAWMGF